MDRKLWASVALLAGMAGSLACVTINVYFPEAAVRDLSQQIEEEVQKRAEQQPAAPETQPEAGGGADRSLLREPALIDTLLGVTPAHAQGVPEPAVSNPAIRKIIESRAARVEALNRFKAVGAIGESNRALLEVRNLEAVSDLRERADVQRLVKAENADREQLFKEIAVAEGVESSQIDRVRETYAETLRANARPGDWIQAASGAWARK